MPTPFSETCEIVNGNTYGTCGSLTRSNISTLTPADIQALFTPTGTGQTGPGPHWAEIQSLLKHQFEMRMCGVVRSPLYDWIMSSNKTGQGRLVNVKRIAKGPSLVEPFILGLQKSVWNQDYWTVVNNWDATAYAALTPAAEKPLDPITAGNRVLSLTSTFNAGLHADYFVPGQAVYIMSRNSGTGAFQLTHFKVVRSMLQTDQGQTVPSAIHIEVKLEQATSNTGAPPGTPPLASDPAVATGVLFQGINNVHDAEAWCYNRLNANLNKLVPFWYQTRRRQRCVDSEYRAVAARLAADNAYFSQFVDLPLAERNRQDERRDQVEFLNAFFFGDRISNNQSLDLWPGLEQIKSVTGGSVTPGTGGMLMGYRANMIGVVPQLKACGQFIDSGGQALNIVNLVEQIVYDIYRARKSMGRPTDRIDIYTNSTTADQFMVAYMAYANAKYGGSLSMNLEEGQSCIGMPFRCFNLFTLPGVKVALITDMFFDDLRLAQIAATPGAYYGNWMMILDLGSGGTIYPAVLASNRRTHTTGELNDLAKIDSTFSCVLELPTIERTLTSETTTVVVECPKNSVVIAGFSSVVHV